jgi:hypothetical protein
VFPIGNLAAVQVCAAIITLSAGVVATSMPSSNQSRRQSLPWLVLIGAPASCATRATATMSN